MMHGCGKLIFLTPSWEQQRLETQRRKGVSFKLPKLVMEFSSVPVYQDSVTLWNQLELHQSVAATATAAGSSSMASEGQQQQQQHEMAGMATSTMASSSKLGSMAERARLAKIPLLEPSIKCPRCESTNTKFCYFNNYSLTQPRHFCKACRRYWTRGGTLRNIPVGGSCRRNRRARPAGNNRKETPAAAAAASSKSKATGGTTGVMLENTLPPLAPSQLPFMGDSSCGTSLLGLSLAGMSAIQSIEYPVVAGGSSGVGLEQWRPLQDFSFTNTMPVEVQLGRRQDLPSFVQSLFTEADSVGGGEGGSFASQFHQKESTSALITQLSNVNMEGGTASTMNTPSHFIGSYGGEDKYESAGGWTMPAIAQLGNSNSESSSLGSNTK